MTTQATATPTDSKKSLTPEMGINDAIFDMDARTFGLMAGTPFMSTDGIVIAGREQIVLGSYVVNKTNHPIRDVTFQCEFPENSGIKLLAGPAVLPCLMPDAPTLVTCVVNTMAVLPGKYAIQLHLTGMETDGGEISGFARGRLFVAQSFKGFFERFGQNDDWVELPRIWTNVAPEGSITTEILKYQGGSPADGGCFPTAFRMSMVPSRPFKTQLSPIPFEDPLWKAVGAALEVSAGKLAVAGAVGTVAAVGTGSLVAASTNANTTVAVGAGVVTGLAVAGVILMLADGEDVFLWGERQTPVDDDEFTLREEGEARLLVGDASTKGLSAGANAEWLFKRITNKRTLTARKLMPLVPIHYTTKRSVAVSDNTFSVGESIQIKAQFEKENVALLGSELYVAAIIVRNEQIVASFPLRDDGSIAGSNANTGVYVGNYVVPKDFALGQYDVMVFAQDVNHADPNDPPLVQAECLGGVLVSTPVLDECFRLKPDATFTICKTNEVQHSSEAMKMES